MYTSPLLQTLPPNVHRTTSTGRFGSKFSKVFPPMLRGIMTEPEYVEYIRRLEEAGKVSKLPYLLFTVAPLLLAGSVMASALLMNFMLSMIISLSCFILSVAIIFGSVFCVTRNSKAALARIEDIISEINQRYYSRGVKWTYVPGTKSTSCYIDVVLFNPNSTAPTDPWTGMSYSTTATATAPGYAATAAPPPTSYSTTGTILSYPGYPSAPPPTATAPQPAYPGDPSKPYAY